MPAPQPNAPPPAPAPIVTETGADLAHYTKTEADRRLRKIYGDHPHQNPGTHLDGGVANDKQWQSHWKRVAQLPTTHYTVPSGKVGRRFVKILTTEFQGARERKWNSERPLVFAPVILQTTSGTRRARDIRSRLTQRMDLWEKGKFRALIDDTEAEVQGRTGSPLEPIDDDVLARRFQAKVLSGRLRQAVRHATNRDGGRVLQPDDACTKTGRPVLEILKEKHPDMREPDLSNPNHHAFEHYDSQPEPIPLLVTAMDIEEVSRKISGGAGPSGVDYIDLRNWLLRFGAESEGLRVEMANWTNWLANSHPPWAAYRALMAARLVALDKEPGVRPVGIGEIYRRLMAKTTIKATGTKATVACGSSNLCAGLPAGIEGAVHALNDTWDRIMKATEPEHAPTPTPTTTPATQEKETIGVGEGPMPEAPDTPDTEPSIALLVDARNGFNELGRKAMLWTISHRWTAGARFAFNCYRHFSQLVLRQRGKPCYIIHSREGVTQGDPLSMILYGITLVPLTEELREEEPTLIQPWYADDAAMIGSTGTVKRAMLKLQELGPTRGYFPEPSKSVLICRDSDRARAKRDLDEFNFQYADGHRYVGGFIGNEASRDSWLDPQIQQWAKGVKILAKISRRFPQAAYAGLAKSLQSEWQYLQRVVPNIGHKFQEVEAAITEHFLPQLLDEEEIPDALRNLSSLPVKYAGLGLTNPVLAADSNYESSAAHTLGLSQSLRHNIPLDVKRYLATTREIKAKERERNQKWSECRLNLLLGGLDPGEKRRTRRAQTTGAWLTAMPSQSNGTDLSAEEFRDSIRIRYGLTPVGLPTKCDGCSQKFTVSHAMACKKGGLIVLRHNEVMAEWHHLCATGLTPSSVSDEPLIHSSRDSTVRTPSGTTEVLPELRGDIAAHGFFRRGTTCIFDVRVVDTDAASIRTQDPLKILDRHEKQKKDKYLEACAQRRRHFSPLVFSVDGMMGTETGSAVKRLSHLLSKKWNRTYSEVCGFVRSRLSISLVRATSMCLRGPRDPTARATHSTWDSGSGLSLYHF